MVALRSINGLERNATKTTFFRPVPDLQSVQNEPLNTVAGAALDSNQLPSLTTENSSAEPLFWQRL